MIISRFGVRETGNDPLEESQVEKPNKLARLDWPFALTFLFSAWSSGLNFQEVQAAQAGCRPQRRLRRAGLWLSGWNPGWARLTRLTALYDKLAVLA